MCTYIHPTDPHAVLVPLVSEWRLKADDPCEATTHVHGTFTAWGQLPVWGQLC